MDTATHHLFSNRHTPANRAKLSALCVHLRKLPQSFARNFGFEGVSRPRSYGTRFSFELESDPSFYKWATTPIRGRHLGIARVSFGRSCDSDALPRRAIEGNR